MVRPTLYSRLGVSSSVSGGAPHVPQLPGTERFPKPLDSVTVVPQSVSRQRAEEPVLLPVSLADAVVAAASGAATSALYQ